VDHLCRLLVTAGVSLPTFFTGLFLIYVFYYLLGWAPAPLGRLDFIYVPPPQVTGFYTLDSLLAGDLETFGASAAQLVLPTVTLGLFALAPIARMTRASMLNALGSEFVRTARANGLSRGEVLITYALRNALLPVLSYLGPAAAAIFTGSFVVEKIFAVPGMGTHVVESINNRDQSLILATVLVYGAFLASFNLIVDLLYGVVDPRIRIGAVQA
jgi:peptide/nickel transport system permease protein